MDFNPKKITIEEMDLLDQAGEEIELCGSTLITCPRCHNKIVFDRVGASYTVSCCDADCISITCRGI